MFDLTAARDRAAARPGGPFHRLAHAAGDRGVDPRPTSSRCGTASPCPTASESRPPSASSSRRSPARRRFREGPPAGEVGWHIDIHSVGNSCQRARWDCGLRAGRGHGIGRAKRDVRKGVDRVREADQHVAAVFGWPEHRRVIVQRGNGQREIRQIVRRAVGADQDGARPACERGVQRVAHSRAEVGAGLRLQFDVEPVAPCGEGRGIGIGRAPQLDPIDDAPRRAATAVASVRSTRRT